nr:unnamed protein product [Callosobruchus chinensis]
MYKLEVRPYIPAPMRCFKCQRFGHSSNSCTAEQLCVCGKRIHEGRPCEQPIVCVNCGGEHSARSKTCPKYKEEAAIQKLIATERLSYPEAKKKIVVETPRPNVSYAQATQRNTQDEILNRIMPWLENVITTTMKEIMETKNTNQAIFIEPAIPIRPIRKEGMETRSRTMSDASISSKRKALSPAEETELSDESANSSQTSIPSSKNKRGWKKGRSRRSNVPDSRGEGTVALSGELSLRTDISNTDLPQFVTEDIG